MQQIYHSNATTNINIRHQIQSNSATNVALSTQFNISEITVSKWKNRDFTQDVSCRPNVINYALSEVESALAISIRTAS